MRHFKLNKVIHRVTLVIPFWHIFNARNVPAVTCQEMHFFDYIYPDKI